MVLRGMVRLVLSVAIGAAGAFGAAQAAEKVVLIGLAVDDGASGNGDGSLGPGETADLKIELYNDGTTAATSITGLLQLDAPVPGVTLLDPLATWPALFPHTAAFTDAPHFRLRVDAFVACGRVLPLTLHVTTGAGSATLPLPLKLGRRVDHDTVRLPARSFSRPDTTYFGPESGDSLGVAVAAGDFNGDGYADVILAAPDADSWSNARPFAGEVDVAYGGPDRRPDTDVFGPVPGIAVFYGVNASDRLGTRLASGDIDGDGYDDLLLAAPGGDGPGNMRLDAGEVYLVYGQPAFWSSVDLATAPPAIVRIWGADPMDGDDNLDSGGVEVATGDLNGDGFDEILLGFDSAASLGNARPGAGEVTILYGRAARFTDIDLAAPPPGTVRLWGADSLDEFGRSIDTGDVDGDGRADLLIGAPGGDSLGNGRDRGGEAYLIRGAVTPLADLDLAAPPPPGVSRIWGGAPGSFTQDSLGWPVAIADLDGDGRGDLVLAAVGADSVAGTRPGAGEVTIVFDTPAGDLDLNASPSGVSRIWGAEHLDALGSAQINRGEGLAAGDFNGDGHLDLAIGASGGDASGNTRPEAGEAALVYGPLVRGVDVDLASPPPNVTRFWGADAGDRMSLGMAAGDVDGDGLDDLVLGAYAADSLNEARVDAGEVYLWHGKPTDTYLARDVPPPAPLDLGETATILPLHCDDCSAPVDLPFPFPFYGESYVRLYVSSNGFLSFAPIDDALSYLGTCFPHRGDANALIAPLWTDLDPAASPGSMIRTRLQGTAPTRRFIVDWIDLHHWEEAGPSPSGATFSAVLYEATGAIRFHFQDVQFGNPLDDAGRSAIVGLENRTGAIGVSFSCRAPDLLGGAGARGLEWTPNTPLAESRFEHQESLWEENPLVWHLNDGCAPASHTGSFGRYAGFNSRCGDAGTLLAALWMPSFPDFPADGRMAFWSRRQVDPAFDHTSVRLSTTGQTYGATVYDVTDNSGQWRYEGIGNLFAQDGDDVTLGFWYDSTAASTPLGWMVDDVQVAGCDADPGGPGGAMAQAFGSEPRALCEGTVPMPHLDASGSYCQDLGAPTSYQWLENGAPIPGANLVDYDVPVGHASGSFGYSIAVECDDGRQAVSAPVPYEIETILGPVDNLRLSTANNGATLVFTWDALPGASFYQVRQDAVSFGGYGTVAASAPAGTVQVQIPMPPGNLFFLVGGWNSCGDGTLN